MIAGWPIKLCTLGGVLSISFGTSCSFYFHVIMTVNLFVSHPVKSDKVTHTLAHTYGVFQRINCKSIKLFVAIINNWKVETVYTTEDCTGISYS